MYTVGLCYAPRKNDTINTTIQSIRYWYKGNIIVSAEPGKKILKDKGVSYIKNKETLGCFKNHHKLFKLLLAQPTEYVLIVQDDFYFSPACGNIINSIIEKKEEFGYYCFHTNRIYGPSIKYKGWNNLKVGFSTGYQVSYLMKKSVLLEVLNHPFYINHLETYEKNQQVDACVTETLRQIGYAMYYHNPSLSIHIGTQDSTIGHSHPVENTFNYF